jgi:hypothetical protein
LSSTSGRNSSRWRQAGFTRQAGGFYTNAAGEQFKLYYKTKNFGTGAYPGGTMTAFDLDGAFTIGGVGTSAYPVIASLASAENTTGITLTESSVATEHRLRLRIVDLYGRAYEDTVELRPPTPPTALVIDPSQGPDRLRVTWTASASPDIKYYNVYRAASGAGPFNLISTDPVPHTLFVNTGLSATTTYFYKASAVDKSGNESALSTAYSGSTNPAKVSNPVTTKCRNGLKCVRDPTSRPAMKPTIPPITLNARTRSASHPLGLPASNSFLASLSRASMGVTRREIREAPETIGTRTRLLKVSDISLSRRFTGCEEVGPETCDSSMRTARRFSEEA